MEYRHSCTKTTRGFVAVMEFLMCVDLKKKNPFIIYFIFVSGLVEQTDIINNRVCLIVYVAK